MSSLRVYELAKELKLDTAALIIKLEELDIPVKSHASTLSDDQAQKVRDAVLGPNPHEVVEKRIKPGVIRRRVLKSEPVPEAPADEAPPAEQAPFEPQPAPERAAAGPTPQARAGQPAARTEGLPAQERERDRGAQRKKKQKRPIEAVIIRKPEFPPSRRAQEPAHPSAAAAPSPVSDLGPVTPLPPSNRRIPYKKPSLSKQKITKLVQIVEPEEPKTPEEIAREGAALEEKKKKKARKKGVKEVPDVPEIKKPPKKAAGRKKEIITKRDIYEGAERLYRPSKRKKKGLPKKMMKKTAITTPKAQKRIIRISGTVQVAELAHRMGIKSADLIKKLIDLGKMANINQFLAFDEAVLVAGDYGYEVENVAVQEENLLKEEEGRPEDLARRPPVVTVMGHVDHGKTTLLDTIRRANVVDGEQGGITQHIGAYSVELSQGRITFIDTPGHEAFTAMRARGAKVTDLVVLVVAADDGVMDRTREAINHAKAAEVPLIVAVNKIDKPEANPDRVRRQLAEMGLNPEDWGGDTLFVNISAKKNIGVKELLDAILLQADLLELKANPKIQARGTILEARMDKGRGPVATALVQDGTLKPQDIVVSGVQIGRIRAMLDEKGNVVDEAAPSTAVQLLGLSGVPEAGDDFIVVKEEKVARQVIEQREEKAREAEIGKGVGRISLEDLYERIQGSAAKELNLILKADVQGSAEALVDNLTKLSTDRCRVNIIHSGVGAINENDAMLASASNAIIVGFNVKADAGARKVAEQEHIQIRVFGIIYELIDDIQRAMLGTLEPTYNEKVIGHAEVRTVFPIAKLGNIAGCYVSDGKIQRNAKARVMREGKEIWVGKIGNLKRFKEDAREVQLANECGIQFENFNDLEEGDVIEAFILEEIAPSL